MDTFVGKGPLNLLDVLQLCPVYLQVMAATPFWPEWVPSPGTNAVARLLNDENLDLSDTQFPFATTILKAIL